MVLRASDQRLAEVSIVGHTGSGTSVAAAPPAVTRSPPEAMDMTDEGAIDKVFAGLSRVDHVLISPGTLRNGAIVKNDLANLRRIVEECLWGLTSVVRHAAPGMSQGSITVTSGSLSSRPRPGTALLTAMLSAVEALAPRSRASTGPRPRLLREPTPPDAIPSQCPLRIALMTVSSHPPDTPRFQHQAGRHVPRQ
jgi:hypothetical protein